MMGSPVSLTDRPESMAPGPIDLLSQVLGQIRLTGDRVFAETLAAGGQLDLATGASYVCIVAQGRVQVRCGDDAPVTVEAGDLVLLTQGLSTQGVDAPRLAALSEGTSILVARFWSRLRELAGRAYAKGWALHCSGEWTSWAGPM